MIFEWDEAKAKINLAKHGVSFETAVKAFLDPVRADSDTSRSQDGEYRRKIVGLVGGRLLTVVYTVRGEAVRLISARRSNPPEARSYGDR